MAPKEPPLGFRGDDTLTEERLDALRPFLPDENLNFPPAAERNPERFRTDLRATVAQSSPERVQRNTEATVTPARREGSVRSLPANRFSPEQGRPSPEATVTTRVINERGKELWNLLSDPVKLSALLGQLTENDLDAEDLADLYEYIEQMGFTADTYFPERVEAIKDKFNEADVEYDESKTADENFDDLIQGNVEAEEQAIRDALNELGIEIPESLQPSDVVAILV